ncbi:hypothetical protein TYRP_006718 [Tyrophagus putrescentiae]|nr:hypothetical protein TYRP_006718 [Tyrophagus putrescentiae]
MAKILGSRSRPLPPGPAQMSSTPSAVWFCTLMRALMFMKTVVWTFREGTRSAAAFSSSLFALKYFSGSPLISSAVASWPRSDSRRVFSSVWMRKKMKSGTAAKLAKVWPMPLRTANRRSVSWNLKTDLISSSSLVITTSSQAVKPSLSWMSTRGLYASSAFAASRLFRPSARWKAVRP